MATAQSWIRRSRPWGQLPNVQGIPRLSPDADRNLAGILNTFGMPMVIFKEPVALGELRMILQLSACTLKCQNNLRITPVLYVDNGNCIWLKMNQDGVARARRSETERPSYLIAG
jgi:hypothetical protein